MFFFQFFQYWDTARTSDLTYLKKVYIHPAHDVLGMSPEGPLKVLTSRTYRDPQRTNAKTDDLMK